MSEISFVMNINEKPVTSFDLEPNPFEQSFASTKKGPVASNGEIPVKNASIGSNSGNAIVTTGASTGVNPPHSNAPVLDNKARLLMNISAGVGATAAGAVAGTVAGGAEAVKSPPRYLTTNKPPTIQSPPILSPGGSRRLPPLNISPNAAISNSLHGQTSPGAFYLNLPKTGLTPNESNIRSGLTPAVMSNGNNNPSNNPTVPTNEIVPGQNNLSAIPVALTSSSGLTPGRFTPMLNSLLNMLSEEPVFPMVNGSNSINNANINSSNVNTIDSNNQAKDESNTSYSNRSPNSSSNNSNILSTHSSTTHSLMSNHPSQVILAADIPLDKVKNPVEIMKTVYSNSNSSITYNNSNNSEPSQSKNAITSQSQRKSSTNNTASNEPAESKENVNGTSSKVSKPTSKKRKASTSSKSKSKVSPNDSDHHSETPYDIDSYPGDTDADRARKRKEFLERNRIAASRFRKRKKEYIKRIEADVSFYESEYNDLSACLASLTGISPHNNSMGNPSLINSLKQALITQDLKSALQVCDMLEHTVLKTKYVQRNGVNTRELAHRSEDMDDSDA